MPTIPRDFVNKGDGSDGSKLTLGHIHDAAADVAAWLYRIASLQLEHPSSIGSPEDMQSRVALYNDLSMWYETLPPKPRYSQDELGNYHYIRFDYISRTRWTITIY